MITTAILFARSATGISGKAQFEGGNVELGNKAYSEIADLANDLMLAANRAYFSPGLYPSQKEEIASLVRKISEHLKALPD